MGVLMLWCRLPSAPPGSPRKSTLRGSVLARDFRGLRAEQRSQQCLCRFWTTNWGRAWSLWRPNFVSRVALCQECRRAIARGRRNFRPWCLARCWAQWQMLGPVERRQTSRRSSAGVARPMAGSRSRGASVDGERSASPSRKASVSRVWSGSDRSSSSQRWESPRASTRIARALARLGRKPTFASRAL
jgi:hypothetical protein